MVNVRPVLSGILSDFYQMITLFQGFPSDIVPLIQEMDTLTSDKEILRESCPRKINKNCQNSVKNLKEKLSRIKAISIKVLKNEAMPTGPMQNFLSGHRMMTEFDTNLEMVKSSLDTISFVEFKGSAAKKKTYFLLKQLDELNTYLSLALVEYIPRPYQNDLRHFYFNFVGPIQLQISKNKNYEFLNRNINSLNFAINLLNMNLTKRKKTPDGMAPYLSVIHNRWNSLLKFYF